MEVDPTGKKAGRGTYLCPDEHCWKQGLKKNRLENAIRSPLPEQDKAALLAHYQEQLKLNNLS